MQVSQVPSPWISTIHNIWKPSYLLSSTFNIKWWNTIQFGEANRLKHEQITRSGCQKKQWNVKDSNLDPKNLNGGFVFVWPGKWVFLVTPTRGNTGDSLHENVNPNPLTSLPILFRDNFTYLPQVYDNFTDFPSHLKYNTYLPYAICETYNHYQNRRFDINTLLK